MICFIPLRITDYKFFIQEDKSLPPILSEHEYKLRDILKVIQEQRRIQSPAKHL